MQKLIDTTILILSAIVAGIVAAGEYLSDNVNEDLSTAAGEAPAGDGAAAPARRRGRGRAAAAATETPAAAAATTSTPAATTAAATTTATAAVAGAGGLTDAKLREMATPLVQAGRGAEVKALTKKFGAESIGQLDPKHYQDVANGIEALLL